MTLKNKNYVFNPSESKRGYKVTLFVDSYESWIHPWVAKLQDIISPFHTVFLVTDKNEIPEGDLNFMLGCTKILEERYLSLNKLNLVIHESDLPSGKGWSPVSWQVLEGCNIIPVVLFEAEPGLDSGQIFLRGHIRLDGSELLPEIKRKQGQKTLELVLKFLEQWPDMDGTPQKGEGSFFPRRTRKDDMLNPNKTIGENFNHLRIADNENYPAWFEHKGKKFVLKIYPFE